MSLYIHNAFRCVPDIHVTFYIDANVILNASSEDKASGQVDRPRLPDVLLQPDGSPPPRAALPAHPCAITPLSRLLTHASRSRLNHRTRSTLPLINQSACLPSQLGCDPLTPAIVYSRAGKYKYVHIYIHHDNLLLSRRISRQSPSRPPKRRHKQTDRQMFDTNNVISRS